MELTRRDFLKGAIATAGLLTVSQILDSPLNIRSLDRVEEKSKQNSKDFLDDKFFPLDENSPSFFGDSNFLLFVNLIRQIDGTMEFKVWNRLDYKDNCIYFPVGFKYRDIPSFLNLLKTKINNPIINKTIEEIKNSYLKRSYYILQAGNGSNYEGLYNENAIKLFTIYCIFNGINDSNTILKQFQDIRNLGINDKEVEKEVYDSMKGFEGKLEVRKGNAKKWSLNNITYSEILKDIISNPEMVLNKLEKDIFGHIDTLEIENKESLKKLISNTIRTKYKVGIILYGNSIRSKNKELVENIIIYIHRLFKTSEGTQKQKFKTKLAGFISQRVNHNIQIALKRNFEKTLYYLMMKDISNQKKLSNICRKSTLLYDLKGETERAILISYISINFEEKFIKNALGKIKDGKELNIEKLITLLPQKNQDEIKQFTKEISNTFNSPHFKKVRVLLKENKITEAKEEIDKMNEREKINSLYIIFSSIGNIVSAKIVDGRLNDNNFGIKHLKKEKDKYSCMAISAIGNYIIENIFGYEGLGISLYRDVNGQMSHILNGIQIGDKLLCIDMTKNFYYLQDGNKIDRDFIVEIDNFANSYITGAYDNIRLANMDKFFKGHQNELIKTLIDENPPQNFTLGKALTRKYAKTK